jgi:hypothetical protein
LCRIDFNPSQDFLAYPVDLLPMMEPSAGTPRFDEDAFVWNLAYDHQLAVYTSHDVLIENGYELHDTEGNRAFVKFAKGFLYSFTEGLASKKTACLVITMVRSWNRFNTGRFLERPPDQDSEWVVASDFKTVVAAANCLWGLREAAKKVGATEALLFDSTDESIVDAFWIDKNAGLAVTSKADATVEAIQTDQVN